MQRGRCALAGELLSGGIRLHLTLADHGDILRLI